MCKRRWMKNEMKEGKELEEGKEERGSDGTKGEV